MVEASDGSRLRIWGAASKAWMVPKTKAAPSTAPTSVDFQRRGGRGDMGGGARGWVELGCNRYDDDCWWCNLPLNAKSVPGVGEVGLGCE